jgi:hypothetical protein
MTAITTSIVTHAFTSGQPPNPYHPLRTVSGVVPVRDPPYGYAVDGYVRRMAVQIVFETHSWSEDNERGRECDYGRYNGMPSEGMHAAAGGTWMSRIPTGRAGAGVLLPS